MKEQQTDRFLDVTEDEKPTQQAKPVSVWEAIGEWLDGDRVDLGDIATALKTLKVEK